MSANQFNNGDSGSSIRTKLNNVALLVDNATETGTWAIGDGSAQDAQINFAGNAQNYHVGLDDTDDKLKIGLGTTLGTTTAITVDSSLNVGIGTSSPSFTVGNKGLHIADATSPAIRLQDTNSVNSDYTIYTPSATNDLRIYHENTAADLVTFQSSGNVGIGTGGPGAKLHVDQATSDAAIPTLLLDQADVSEEMIEFTSTVGVGNAIEAVGAKALTTTHFIKCTITGVGTVYFPVGTIA